MSAYAIGSTAYAGEKRAAGVRALAGDNKALRTQVEPLVEGAKAPTREDGLAAIVKWVPAEVLATYIAVLAALTDPDAQLRDVLLWGFVIGAVVWTFLAATLTWQKLDTDPKTDERPKFVWFEMLMRSVFAAVGFLLWSFVVPGSATSEWGWVSDNAIIVAPIVFLIAILYSMAAASIFHEVERRKAPNPPPPNGGQPPTKKTQATGSAAQRSRRWRRGRPSTEVQEDDTVDLIDSASDETKEPIGSGTISD